LAVSCLLSQPILVAVRSVTAGLMLAVSCGHALAAPDDAAWAVFGALPAQVDAAAAFDRPGTALLVGGPTRAATDAAAGAGLFRETRRAWGALAHTLGLSTEDAARTLLGGRVVIGWQGLATDGVVAAAVRADARWVLIAEIDAPTARQVRARLNAVPRRIVGDRAVYSVDAGRMGMAVIEDGAAARLVLAPNEAAGLLDAVVLGQDAPSVLGRMGSEALGQVEDGWSALVVIRIPGEDHAAAGELRSSPEGWGLRFAARSEPGESHTGAPVGVLDQVGGDAVLAVATAGAPRASGNQLDLRVRLGAVDNPGPAPEVRFESGAVVVLRETQDAVGVAGLTALMVTRARTEDRFPERLDRMVSGMIGGKHPPEHRGAFPEAVRTHTIGEEIGEAWPGRDGQVAWCFGQDPGGPTGVVAVAVAPSGVDPSGVARKGREAWDRGASITDASVITTGYALPARMTGLLGLPESSPMTALAKAVERADWSVRRVDGFVRGDVRLRFTPEAARLGKP
jgi:hypothetical protein